MFISLAAESAHGRQSFPLALPVYSLDIDHWATGIRFADEVLEDWCDWPVSNLCQASNVGYIFSKAFNDLGPYSFPQRFPLLTSEKFGISVTC